MSRTHISAVINGDETEFLTEDGTSLLNALRDEVGLTGAKEGCGTGDCGSCSVLIDDRVTCACLVFAPEADGATIVTVEGLRPTLQPARRYVINRVRVACADCGGVGRARLGLLFKFAGIVHGNHRCIVP